MKWFVRNFGPEYVEKAFSYYPPEKLMGKIILETMMKYGDDGD